MLCNFILRHYDFFQKVRKQECEIRKIKYERENLHVIAFTFPPLASRLSIDRFLRLYLYASLCDSETRKQAHHDVETHGLLVLDLRRRRANANVQRRKPWERARRVDREHSRESTYG